MNKQKSEDTPDFEVFKKPEDPVNSKNTVGTVSEFRINNGVASPKESEGLDSKNMGTIENQFDNLITKQQKTVLDVAQTHTEFCQSYLQMQKTASERFTSLKKKSAPQNIIKANKFSSSGIPNEVTFID